MQQPVYDDFDLGSVEEYYSSVRAQWVECDECNELSMIYQIHTMHSFHSDKNVLVCNNCYRKLHN